MTSTTKAAREAEVRPGPSKLRLNALTWLNRGLGLFGMRIAISRAKPAGRLTGLSTPHTSYRTMPTALEGALYGLLSSTPRLNIIQIGANDGFSGDPIHKFIENAWSETNLLLCEPQPELVKLLKDTYRDHPSLQVFLGAVTPEGERLVLYRVKPEHWSQVHAGFLIEYPSYVAPSGIASVNFSHVADFVQRWSTLDPDSAIEELLPETLSVSRFVERYLGTQPVHLLQVDAEGLDVTLVREALAAGLRPNVINFEHSHADVAAVEELSGYLERCQYRVFKYESDILAIRSQSG